MSSLGFWPVQNHCNKISLPIEITFDTHLLLSTPLMAVHTTRVHTWHLITSSRLC